MLQIRNLTKQYGKTEAVSDVSFDIDQGEFVSLVGPSGSGKTTILRILSGHLSPTDGTIELRSEDITDTSPQQRPTSQVFQSLALFPHLTVRENVLFPIRLQDRDAQQVDKWLRRVQLDPEEYADKNPAELSGGERQRVALARSLAYEPDILLLDEPLASLDYVLRKELQRELTRLQTKLGRTFVYVTHSLEAAMLLSDRIIVLNQGTIVEQGTPSEIYNQPETRFVADFMGDANIFPISVKSRTNGHIEVISDSLDTEIKLSARSDLASEFTHMVVRHTQCEVRPDPTEATSLAVEIDSIMFKSNNAIVETTSLDGANRYVSEMPYDRVHERGLSEGDECYIQWDPESAILTTE
ncbi:ABC transporter ATP-binding protein [Haloplanus pelagicus]|jgi:ABC-type Fe3+/spermidine/putrescine transport system ATPase subunit|uniref:ABC transporter ATP-binding protein n=1 Tax=Haloplanus pelagicus TaxID=2949995 RepID=UPI00211315BA|nr:ABC transporter ATP-binding protein [Haloplanus sp. HW8-1]